MVVEVSEEQVFQWVLLLFKSLTSALIGFRLSVYSVEQKDSGSLLHMVILKSGFTENEALLMQRINTKNRLHGRMSWDVENKGEVQKKITAREVVVLIQRENEVNKLHE